MAWCYQIALECGSAAPTQQAAAAALADMCTRIPEAFYSQHCDDLGNVWICLNISHLTCTEAEWKVIADPLWEDVVARLDFRFGFCGLEVEQARTYSELMEGEMNWAAFGHVALSTPVWMALDCPAGFVATRDGMMVWRGI
jgi:hypothetical protein